MDNAEEILVIILSTTLAIFLILGIVALVKINKILKHIEYITAKAEKIADKAEAVGDFFQKTAGSTALVKLVSNIVNSFKAKGKGE